MPKHSEIRSEAGSQRRSPALRAVLCTVAALSCLPSLAARAGAPEPEPDDGRWQATGPAEPEAPPREIRLDGRASTSNRVQSPAPALPSPADRAGTPRTVLDPSARLLHGDDASEAWTLFVDLDSGHRITQRFLLSNAGPGEHNAVAIGHLLEPGRSPYRYENGRRRPRWTLSDDRLFFDIAASHLDLHRPDGELRITKDDIEIRLFFDFDAENPSASVLADRLPPGYRVDVLAMAAPTRGSIEAPWMSRPLETAGRTWLVHTWTEEDESELLQRRVEIFGHENETSFYGIQLQGRNDWKSAWSAIVSGKTRQVIESEINVSGQWSESAPQATSSSYPTPNHFQIRDAPFSGQITLGQEWLRFDPLEVIPQPFRWFIRRTSQPQEVWADAQIEVRLSVAPGTPSLSIAGETTSAKTEEASRSRRETEDETAKRSVKGVASITFLNPTSRR